MYSARRHFYHFRRDVEGNLHHDLHRWQVACSPAPLVGSLSSLQICVTAKYRAAQMYERRVAQVCLYDYGVLRFPLRRGCGAPAMNLAPYPPTLTSRLFALAKGLLRLHGSLVVFFTQNLKGERTELRDYRKALSWNRFELEIR